MEDSPWMIIQYQYHKKGDVRKEMFKLFYLLQFAFNILIYSNEKRNHCTIYIQLKSTEM